MTGLALVLALLVLVAFATGARILTTPTPEHCGPACPFRGCASCPFGGGS